MEEGERWGGGVSRGMKDCLGCLEDILVQGCAPGRGCGSQEVRRCRCVMVEDGVVVLKSGRRWRRPHERDLGMVAI